MLTEANGRGQESYNSQLLRMKYGSVGNLAKKESGEKSNSQVKNQATSKLKVSLLSLIHI